MILRIKNLHKTFGDQVVLQDIALTIKQGECHGLIGKNGSGKSTLINIIVNLLPPDGGTIELFGKKWHDHPQAIKKKIGVLPEINPVIDEFSVQDYLEYVGLIYGMNQELIQSRTEYLINYFFEDVPSPSKSIGQYSKGMKLKTGICAALIHKPKFLILDEPFDGLDVFSSKNLAAFLNDYRAKGNTVLVSSHDLLYMDKIASHIDLIKGAELLHLAKEDVQNNGKSFEDEISDRLGYKPKELGEF
ncbi:ABC transporter ATP-binding protein [Fodinibius halophilus]|uniref:ABC transporter ATP-binding protein n=1 Tax=Fodinibius halophilus TaxID=1736908 RepID=A0A6M1TC10_9BACT|nr:ABC transporter ATP-binding protein [Fodinibius halophilus]NGP88464.1 ABC transporter ATP-binding protein [Fodinibius halophilus]